MGALNTVWAVGALISPTVAGAIAERAGDGAAYALTVVVIAAGAVFVARAARANQRSRPASSSGDVTGRRQAKRSHT
jgi:hypothetical protein